MPIDGKGGDALPGHPTAAPLTARPPLSAAWRHGGARDGGSRAGSTDGERRPLSQSDGRRRGRLAWKGLLGGFRGAFRRRRRRRRRSRARWGKHEIAGVNGKTGAIWKKVTVEPDGFDAVGVSQLRTFDCAAAGAVCTGDGRPLMSGNATLVLGPPALSVADAEAHEGPDAALAFAVNDRMTLWGLAGSGGMDALLGRTTLTGLAANDHGDELANRRLDLKFGYGFSAFSDRFTSIPEIGLGLSDSARDYSLGWRLAPTSAAPTRWNSAARRSGARAPTTMWSPGTPSGSG